MADALTDTKLNRAVVDTWSMRDFVPASGISGHDHFFDAFRETQWRPDLERDLTHFDREAISLRLPR
jgi:hypothetical protein